MKERKKNKNLRTFTEQYAKTHPLTTIWQPGNHPHVVAPRILSTGATDCQLRLRFFAPPKAVRQSFGCSMRVTMSTQIALGTIELSKLFLEKNPPKYRKSIQISKSKSPWIEDVLHENSMITGYTNVFIRFKLAPFLPQSRLIVASSAWHFTFRHKILDEPIRWPTIQRGGKPVKDLPPGYSCITEIWMHVIWVFPKIEVGPQNGWWK